MIVGTPKTVIAEAEGDPDVLRPGSLMIFSVQGPVANEDRQTSMRLIAQEIIPALKEHAKSIDLPDAFERTPGSVTLNDGVSRSAVVDRGPLKELGLR